jgi:hypothetical protein
MIRAARKAVQPHPLAERAAGGLPRLAQATKRQAERLYFATESTRRRITT